MLAKPLTCIYAKVIDGIPESPPLITSVKPHLQVNTVIGMSDSALNTYKELREYPLAYRIRDVTKDIVGGHGKFDSEGPSLQIGWF